MPRRLMLALTATALLGAAAPHNAPVRKGELLVDAAWLKAHLQDPNLVILQVGERATYDKEHLPNARFVTHTALARRTPDSLSLEMLPPDSLRTSLEALGISNDSRVVVVFSDEWMSPSTRVLFTLQYAGLRAQSSLLDGGLGAWKRAGNPVTANTPSVRRGHLTLHLAPEMIVTAAYVQGFGHAARAKLVDARAAQFYSGPSEPGMSGGHIPGAVSVPFTTMADDSMVFYSPAELEQKFRAVGVQPGDTVVGYCHVGQQATMMLFGAELTGHPVRLYDGSMQDWTVRKLPTVGAQ